MFDLKNNVIRAYGIIGTYDDEISTELFMTALDELNGEDVTIRLQSEGGDVMQGLSIYNLLSGYEGEITVVGDSLVASIATVIAMAGDQVLSHDNTTWMIHRAWTIALGNAPQFRQTAEVLEKLDRDIANAYADRADGDADEFLKLMERESWLSAEDAMGLGMIDGLVKTEPKAMEVPKITACARAFPNRARLTAMLQSQKIRLHRQGKVL